MITNVTYSGLDLNKDFGFVVNVTVDAPPGAARLSNAILRRDYFESNSRLPYGGLVVVITREATGTVMVDLAILTTCRYSPLTLEIALTFSLRQDRTYIP